MTSHTTPSRRHVAAAVALAGAACAQPALAQMVRPAPAIAVAAPTTAPAMHFVQTPQGLMRVPDAVAAAPGGAPKVAALAVTGKSIAATQASTMPMHVVSANGASMRVPGAATQRGSLATSAGKVTTMAVTQRAAVNGGVVRALPSVPTTDAATAARARLAIVDIDPSGHTLNPGDAQRRDVLFRRVDKLSAH
jgi:hypothetical protein